MNRSGLDTGMVRAYDGPDHSECLLAVNEFRQQEAREALQRRKLR